ncbi:MAG: hypothetical protein MJE63_13865 [Proteobacteria bacterium]|nr:hypothetical protein [Pseudomonadota bacterium]
MITKQDYLKMQNFPDEMDSIPTYIMQFTESVNSSYEDVIISSVAGIAHGRHEKHTKWSDVLLALKRFSSKQDLLENPSLIFDEQLCKEDPGLKNGFYFYRIDNKLYLAQGMHRFIIMKFAGIQTVKNVLVDERVFVIPPKVLKKVQYWGYAFKKDWFASEHQSKYQLCKAAYSDGVIQPGAQIDNFLTQLDFDNFLSGIDLEILRTAEDFKKYCENRFNKKSGKRRLKRKYVPI